MASSARVMEVSAVCLASQQQECLEHDLQSRLGAERFELWFAGKTQWRLVGESLEVAAANEFAAGWMRSRFLGDIAAAAQVALGHSVRVEVLVAASVSTHTVPVSVATDGSDPTVHSAITGAIRPAPAMHRPTREASPVAVLNPRYTFEEFVVGACNQMAYHAAVRVAEQPGTQFNPLFIHGSCGLGKTHLLQSICQRFSKRFGAGTGGGTGGAKKWLYLTGEQFTNDFVESIRTHKTEAFRRRIRSADLLIIDDVHFLANKKATQEEFLHTFNQIDTNGKQVVLASDCPPRAIAAMTDGLISRFISGMVVRVDTPDLATRLEILKRKAVRNHWTISDAMLMHLAQQSVSSVRELEGALLQVVAGASLLGATGDTLAGDTLQNLRQRQAPDHAPVAVERIVAAVAALFDLAPTHLLGSSREKTISLARAVAMSLTRQLTAMSFPEIGRALGNKNHSTVIAACQRISELTRSGELVCWHTRTAPQPEIRHQTIADIMHELSIVLRKK